MNNHPYANKGMYFYLIPAAYTPTFMAPTVQATIQNPKFIALLQ